MTDPIKEQLSACLDGELPESELDLLVKQVARDPQLRRSLGRYALLGDALRGQRPVAAPADFAQRISAAIQSEPASPAVVQRPVRTSPAWLRPVAGFAVAAGVAAVAVFALQPATENAPYIAEETSNPTVALPAESEDSYIVPTGTASSGLVPAARLTNYVVAHSEYSTPLGRRSVLSGVLAEDAGDVEAATDSEEDSTLVTQP